MLLTNFTTMFLILQQLRIFQNISSPPPWKLQTTGQWHVEYGIWNTTIASLQFWAEDLDPITPRHSLRICLHNFLLDAHQSHAMSAT